MGKNKYIETPEKMWELFESYKADTKIHPRTVLVFGGKDFETKRNELERPLTMEGFENYVCDQELNQELSHYFSNKDKRYTDYVAICSRVRREIRQDQIEGGMVGQYNASITQRLNNLVDRQENTVKVEQPLFGEDE